MTVRLPFEYATIGLTLAAAFPVIVAVSTVASQVMLNPAGTLIRMSLLNLMLPPPWSVTVIGLIVVDPSAT